jgi:hypothetical protein
MDEYFKRQQRILGLLELLNDRLADIEGRVDVSDIRQREWWTEREACERKGVSHSVLRRPENRRYLPNHGRPARLLSNGHYKNMYHWSWVAEWLPMDQAAIDDRLKSGEWLERVDEDGRVLSNAS